jgi:hypothetical protein
MMRRRLHALARRKSQVFDGMKPRGHPIRAPTTFDISAPPPRLRGQVSEAQVESLAVCAARRVIEAAHRTSLTNGAGADLESVLLSAQDPATPTQYALEALAALSDAIGRHRLVTGDEGSALAYSTIKQSLGAMVADQVLELLLDHGTPK